MVTFYRRLPKFGYLIPKTLEETLSLLSQYRGRAKVMAGGTDLVPKLKRREIKTPEYVIDLKGVPNLNYIKYEGDNGLKLGALTTIRALATSTIIQDKSSILFQAANSMACVQVRNRGTLAGNICNAVPSADTAPALLTLEARVKLLSLKGERLVNVEDFFIGPGETVLNDDEILGEIQVPNLPQHSRGVYLKLTPRRSMDLAIVGVAVVLIPDEGICKDIRIALGAVSPTPIRAKKAETVIRGQTLHDEVVEKAAQIATEECQPINDHRASAEYRTEMVKVMVRRAIKKAFS
jgi:CO/xanthine dehydrogenase FAD-binding subunit